MAGSAYYYRLVTLRFGGYALRTDVALFLPVVVDDLVIYPVGDQRAHHKHDYTDTD